MCKILMPINPKYVDKILSGKKKYEYRKTKAKKVYESHSARSFTPYHKLFFLQIPDQISSLFH